MDHFDDFYHPALTAAGYKTLYCKRPRDKADGSVIAWKIEKWREIKLLKNNYNKRVNHPSNPSCPVNPDDNADDGDERFVDFNEFGVGIGASIGFVQRCSRNNIGTPNIIIHIMREILLLCKTRESLNAKAKIKKQFSQL